MRTYLRFYMLPVFSFLYACAFVCVCAYVSVKFSHHCFIFFLQESDSSTAFHLACAQGSLEIVQLLSATDKEVCKAGLLDDQGMVPLHRAAVQNHVTVVSFLLDQVRNICNHKVILHSVVTIIVGTTWIKAWTVGSPVAHPVREGHQGPSVLVSYGR